MNRSILIIYTGGTIGMKADSDGVLRPFDFNDIHEEFPNIRQLEVEVEVMAFPPIDSSNVTPELWVMLAEIIHKRYDEFDGFIVLHGTDTMSYTASALSFMLENLSKPVIFTGSQIPLGIMRTDGRENLITAIEIAAAQDSQGVAIVPEVCLYFQNKLFRANRTTKYSVDEFNAFHSDNYPPLAEVGVNIHYNGAHIAKPSEGSLKINTQMSRGVVIIKIFPGMSKELFCGMLEMDGVKGVILESYGSGNAPTADWFMDAVSSAVGRGLPLLNITQCSSGTVAMDMYETGVGLQRAGVISGYDSTTEAAITKLMYLLGLDLPYARLIEQLKKSIRGEITIN